MWKFFEHILWAKTFQWWVSCTKLGFIFKMQEYFVIIVICQHSGAPLATTGPFSFIVDCLNQNSLEILNIRGQGYDNGVNMKGNTHNRLQKKIDWN